MAFKNVILGAVLVAFLLLALASAPAAAAAATEGKEHGKPEAPPGLAKKDTETHPGVAAHAEHSPHAPTAATPLASEAPAPVDSAPRQETPPSPREPAASPRAVLDVPPVVREERAAPEGDDAAPDPRPPTRVVAADADEPDDQPPTDAVAPADAPIEEMHAPPAANDVADPPIIGSIWLSEEDAAIEPSTAVTRHAPGLPWSTMLPALGVLGAATVVVGLALRRPNQRTATGGAPAVEPSRRRTPMAPVPPDDLQGLLRNAQAAVERGDVEEALSWFDRAVAIAPHVAVAHFCRGICYASLGRVEEAVGALARAVELAPDEAAYRIHYARIAVSVGLTREAMDALSPVAQAIPELQDAMLGDAQLSVLRDHPRFLSMMGRL